MIYEYVGVEDVINGFAFRNVAFVVPTIPYAFDLWPRLLDCAFDRHGEDYIASTKTAIVSRRTRTVLRLWVPYERSPTMVLDFPSLRRDFELYTPFDRRVVPR